jgi:hypothetical protein
LGILTQRREDIFDFLQRGAAHELDRGNPVAVEPVRQFAQKRVVRIGGHRFDYQAVPRNPKGHGLSALEK